MIRASPRSLTARWPGLRFVATSVGLVGGKAVSMAVGFLFWLLAARAAQVDDVGLAAGAISLMMLATQLAIAGAGSSFILNRARYEHQLPRLLDTAITIVLLGSTAAAVTALGVVALALDELRPVATDPAFALVFVLMTVFGTLGILMDHVSVALQRGQQVLARNTTAGLLTAAPLAVSPLLGFHMDALSLFACWVLGGAGACSIAARQLSGQLGGYRYRPCLSRPLVAVLLRTGLPNHALTLVERAPNLLLPVVVTEVLTAQANAYWYMAWMMAWAVLVIPVSIGVTLLAEVSRRRSESPPPDGPDAHLTEDPPPAELVRPGVLRAVRVGLVLGIPAAALVAVVGPPVLAALGPGFREGGSTPLRVLLLALLPVLVLQLYYSVCRSTRHLREALLTGGLLGAAALAVTATVAGDHGLVGMAWAWVAVQTAAGGWAALRLARLVPGRAATAGGPALPSPRRGRPSSAFSGQDRDRSVKMGS